MVEPSPTLITGLREKFADIESVSVLHQDFEAVARTTESQSFDCVILVNVLEHIEDDAFAVRECRRILRPGGHLLILVPALSFLYSKLDALAGHYRRYGSKELTVRIIDAGFRLEKQCYFDTLGIVPWWVLNILEGATAFNPTLVNLI